jgi:GT2 family glycosyltransferase
VTEPVSVIVCTRNRAESLRLSLESIVAERPNQIVVVDQSTDDASKAVVGTFDDSANVLYMHTEKAGLSRAYNLGIAAANTELLAFTDDDCTVPAGWLAAIAGAFEENPAAAMMYGQVKAGEMVLGPGDYIPVLPFAEIRRYSPGDRFEVFGMGANFAARRSDLVAVGGFDEALGGGGMFRSSQDSDMQLRLWRSGRTVLAHPGFSVAHFGARTPAQWQGTARAYGFGDGAFLIKHLRLRDKTAARLLASKALREAIVPIARVLKRRSYSPEYALGLCQGVRAGLRHPVDQRSRKYLLDA